MERSDYLEALFIIMCGRKKNGRSFGRIHGVKRYILKVSLVIYVGGRSYEVVCGWNGAYKRHVRFPFITSSRHPIPTLLAFYKLS